MPSRRDVLIGATVAGVAALTRPVSAGFARASPAITSVNFEVPAGACDCHTHLFGDSRRFPLAPSRTYTPEPASVEEMRAFYRVLGTERVVVVQPSVYGTDNACALDGIRQLGTSARGVAVIDDRTSEAALEEMDRAGIRGIRINLATTGQTNLAAARQRFQTGLRQIKNRRWHIQVYAQLSVIEGMEDQVLSSPVPVVFDHFGGAQASLGVQQPGFEVLLNLVRTGKAYVKLSAAYRASTQGPDYPDATPLAKALIAANPRRVLWGSDWPHPDSSQLPSRKPTDVAPRLQIDDGHLFNLLPVWAPDPAQRRAILVENPATLYRF